MAFIIIILDAELEGSLELSSTRELIPKLYLIICFAIDGILLEFRETGYVMEAGD